MTEHDDRTHDTSGGRASGEDALARLLRAAGARPQVPEDAAGRVRAATHASWRRAVRGRRIARWIVYSAAPLAAAAAWLFLVGPDLSRRLGGPPPAPVAAATLERVVGTASWPGGVAPAIGADLAAGTVLETGGDGRIAARLGAGTSLRVDSGTLVRLESAGEVVLERGAVYLDTGPGGSAVVVRTALGLVRDVGTQFQVRIEETGVGVSVREGAARFEGRDASREASAGVRLTVQGDGSFTTREIPRSGSEWDWILEIASPFRLEGRLLGEYLGWVARETGLRIQYADPTIEAGKEDVVLHGSIEGLRPEATLGIVLPTCGLAHTVSGDTLVVQRAPAGSAS
jgi:hypothetical protein